MNFWLSNLDFFEWIKNILTENLWRLSYYKIDEPHAEDLKSCPERDGNISGINKGVCIGFIDYRKVFYRVKHDILINILKELAQQDINVVLGLTKT